ncbi:hypothetical protein HY968_00185 [Candidatus Kaiserbacteria bacterium]|nr:hypothetical protein [Candidatus Kaiserbacteria bacterium]
MKVNADFTKILGKDTEEKWVALSEDRKKLIDSGPTLPELRERLGEKRNDYIYMKVLRSDMEYSFGVFS